MWTNYKVNKNKGLVPNLELLYAKEITVQQFNYKVAYYLRDQVAFEFLYNANEPKLAFISCYANSRVCREMLEVLFPEHQNWWTVLNTTSSLIKLMLAQLEYFTTGKPSIEWLRSLEQPKRNRIILSVIKTYNAYRDPRSLRILNNIIKIETQDINKNITSITDYVNYVNQVKNHLASKNLNYIIQNLVYNTTKDIWVCNILSDVLEESVVKYYYLNREDGAIENTKVFDLPLFLDIDSIYRVPGTTSSFYNGNELYYDGRIFFDKTKIKLVACPNCRREVVESNLLPDNLGCHHCEDELGKVHNYSTRVPNLLSFKVSKVYKHIDPIYLGVELEYESKSSKLDAIRVNSNLKTHAILKSDSSIRNGFEIVTCPATLDIHLKEFSKFYSEVFPKTKLYTNTNVGMHIHISRKPLGMLGVGKMTYFLNKETNKHKLELIGGRNLNSYCNQDSSRTYTYNLGKGGARYNILNLNNEATVEIRMFASPKNFEEFKCRIEFAEALAKYCSPAMTPLSVTKFYEWDSFNTYVQNNKKFYPELSTFMKGI